MNKTNKKLISERKKHNLIFSALIRIELQSRPPISPIEYISLIFHFVLEVEPFAPVQMSEKILLRLLKHPNVIQELKYDEKNKRAIEHYLFHRNKPVDYFILVLQVSEPRRKHRREFGTVSLLLGDILHAANAKDDRSLLQQLQQE